MTVWLVFGGLAFAVVLLVLRPFPAAARARSASAGTADEDRRRALLRQLRDLDDDLADGKLTGEDHRRLRDPVEREAAAVLRRVRHEAAAARASSRDDIVVPARRRRRPSTRGDVAAAPRRRRRIVIVLALAAATASVAVLLAGAVTPRGPGQTVSGDVPAAAGTPSSAAPSGPADTGDPAADPGDPAAGPAGAQRTPTPEEAAAIAAAVLTVKSHPKDVSAHIALAHAYADGGTTQLAAVEFLAILRLDPANPEANTALALLAFEVGQAAQAKGMVDQALATDPTYPEALYVRGLILLTGLHQPQAAVRDLKAYLAIAPHGSHSTAAATLLALAGSQEHK